MNNPLTRQYLPVALVAFALVCTTATVQAHDRGSSYSYWSFSENKAHIHLRLSELDVSRFPWAAYARQNLRSHLGDYVSTHLRLESTEGPCSPMAQPLFLKSNPGHFNIEWRVACPSDEGLFIAADLIFALAPSHLHFARVKSSDKILAEHVFSQRSRRWALPFHQDLGDRPEDTAGWLNYLLLGIEHILGGIDHIVFLIALLLLPQALSQIAKVITGFTLGHSLTLGLMTLGYFRPDPAPIEALIGLSIALVAIENVWLVGSRRRLLPLTVVTILVLLSVAAGLGFGVLSQWTLLGLSLFVLCYFSILSERGDERSLRWGVAGLFGLIHGFGFAAMLNTAGLGSWSLLGALLSFNLGVEVGQIALLTLLWPILRAVSRSNSSYSQLLHDCLSGGVVGLGLYWFIIRGYA